MNKDKAKELIKKWGPTVITGVVVGVISVGATKRYYKPSTLIAFKPEHLQMLMDVPNEFIQFKELNIFATSIGNEMFG